MKVLFNGKSNIRRIIVCLMALLIIMPSVPVDVEATYTSVNHTYSIMDGTLPNNVEYTPAVGSSYNLLVGYMYGGGCDVIGGIDSSGNFTSAKVDDDPVVLPSRFETTIKAWKMIYLTVNGRSSWYFYVDGDDNKMLAQKNGKLTTVSSYSDALAFTITRVENQVRIKDRASQNYFTGIGLDSDYSRSHLYQMVPNSEVGLNYLGIGYKYKLSGQSYQSTVRVADGLPFRPSDYDISLPCNTDLDVQPTIGNITLTDPNASYTSTVSAFKKEFRVVNNMIVKQYCSTVKVSVKAENGTTVGTYNINLWVNSHNLSYEAYGSVVFETCSNTGCSHNETATLSSVDAVYDGSRKETASIAYSDRWDGSKEATINYTNNINVGNATASATIEGKTVYSYFNIGRATHAAIPLSSLQISNESVYGKGDGAISGVTSSMQWREAGTQSYSNIYTTRLSNLTPGKYYLRYKQTDNYNASSDVEVTIGAGEKIAVVFMADGNTVETKYVAWNGSIPIAEWPDVPEKLGFNGTWDKTADQLTGIIAPATVTAVYKVKTFNVTLSSGAGYALTPIATSTSPVDFGKSFSFTLNIKDGYSKLSNFSVKCNGNDIEPVNGIYTVSDIRDAKNIQVEGVGDNTSPNLQIVLNSSIWDELKKSIPFKWFFTESQTVTIYSRDIGSGLEQVSYYLADKEMTENDLKNVTDWNVAGNDMSFSIAVDNKYIIYARAIDKSGNVKYVSSEGIVIDSIAPTIDGITDGATYYTTRKVTPYDLNLDKITVNGVETNILPGNVDMTYEVIATDLSGNFRKIKVNMKSIASIGRDIDNINKNNVTVKDKDKIDVILNTIDGIDISEATDEEKEKIATLKTKANNLLEEIKVIENDKTKTSSDNDSLKPATGDEAYAIWMYVIIMMSGVAFLISMAYYRKRQ